MARHWVGDPVGRTRAPVADGGAAEPVVRVPVTGLDGERPAEQAHRTFPVVPASEDTAD